MKRSWHLPASCLILAASASAAWYGPSLPANSAFPGARLSALGSPRYLDSARCNQYSFAGDPAGLVGADTSRFIRLDLGMRQLALSGAGAERSHFDLMPEFRAGMRGAFGVRLAYQPVFEESRDTAGLPRFSTADHRVVFDIAWANGPSQAFVGGLGATLRLGSQEQDTMFGHGGLWNAGQWKRSHPSLEALRLSLGSRIAGSVTVTARAQVAGTLDSLEHTGGALLSDGVTAYVQQDRVATMILPGFGLAVLADNPAWPVRGITDLYYGVNRRLATTQSNFQNGEGAVKHPVQVADSLHWRLLVQGRVDRPLPGHLFEPVLGMQYVTSATTLRAPKGQNNNPLDLGPEAIDSGWTRSGFDLVLGLAYSWESRLRAGVEWERAGTQVSTDSKLPAIPVDEAVDHRVSLGLELFHTLVPALAAKMPEGTGLVLRTGWQRLSMRGDELRPGWFTTMRRGYSAGSTSSSFDLAPGLGVASDASATTFGLGGWMLDRRLTLDFVLGIESWNPQPGPEQSGLSWGLDASWRM